MRTGTVVLLIALCFAASSAALQLPPPAGEIDPAQEAASLTHPPELLTARWEGDVKYRFVIDMKSLMQRQLFDNCPTTPRKVGHFRTLPRPL
ncbi:MAG TPA: hypothetical protein VIM11_26990 [Tepidisphaeraceae bacterium]|jgi:hypothetical protein